MNITPLIQYFSGYWPLDRSAAESLAERVATKNFKRKQYILEAGKKCEHFTFVISGCVRMHKEDEKGNQHNLQFATENQWISDYGSFYQEEPSDLFIETLEPTKVFMLKNNDLYYLYDHFPVFDRNFRIIIENAFIEQQKRVLQTISSSAEERYRYFLKKYPELVNRISNVQIASYIGVTPEFLSVIRKKITFS